MPPAPSGATISYGPSLLPVASTSSHLVRRTSRCRLDVLVHAEEICGVVLLLNAGETTVIVAESGLNPILALVHHEVDVSAAGGIGMQGLPIFLAPGRDLLRVSRVGVHAHDDLGEQGLAETVARLVAAHALRRTVDGVEVHR